MTPSRDRHGTDVDSGAHRKLGPPGASEADGRRLDDLERAALDARQAELAAREAAVEAKEAAAEATIRETTREAQQAAHAAAQAAEQAEEAVTHAGDTHAGTDHPDGTARPSGGKQQPPTAAPGQRQPAHDEQESARSSKEPRTRKQHEEADRDERKREGRERRKGRQHGRPKQGEQAANAKRKENQRKAAQDKGRQHHKRREDKTQGQPPPDVGDLNTDLDNGLSGSEAQHRLEEHGPNTIEEAEEGTLRKLAGHFWGPIPWMLEAAMVISAAVQHWEDFAVIAALVAINGIVGFWQEHKAENVIDQLKQQLAPETSVLRDGSWDTISAEKLVPGDIVKVQMGSVVPADVLLVKGGGLRIDESSLTGESLPVDKEQGDQAYSGTSVQQGQMVAAVTATGMDTRFATTAAMVAEAGHESHFQRAVVRIGYFLIALTAAYALVVGLVQGIARGSGLQSSVIFALVLLIGGIPAALPPVLTMIMALGANRLAERKAIVSQLDALEEMASIDLLCSDKTGTLTRNQMQLQDPVVIEADDKDDLIVAAGLTCQRDSDDPIDTAVLGGMDDTSVLDDYDVTDFTPFNPTDKRATAQVRHEDDTFTVTKGAPQVILGLVDPGGDQRDQVKSKVDELGQQGYRSLGVARKGDGQWQYLGLLPLLDPPREDTAEVVDAAKDHGIDVRMVTGDHAAIGKQVAQQVHIGDTVVEASDLFSHAESGDEINSDVKQQVLEANAFAEVTPEHKYRLIRYFQDADRRVAMTGDGVNDAPALKQADIGIAVAGATDAARAASELVLMEPGLGVITHAVEEARRIFERMVSYATFRVMATLWLMVYLGTSILLWNVLPVSPVMTALLAILNDIPIMTIAYDHVRTAHHPVRWNMHQIRVIAGVLGAVGLGASFGVIWYARNVLSLTLPELQTYTFLWLLIAPHLAIYLTRNGGPIWQKPYPSWILITATELTQVAGTLLAVFGYGFFMKAPIGWVNAGEIWGFSFALWFIMSGVKLAIYKWILHRETGAPA